MNTVLKVAKRNKKDWLPKWCLEKQNFKAVPRKSKSPKIKNERIYEPSISSLLHQTAKLPYQPFKRSLIFQNLTFLISQSLQNTSSSGAPSPQTRTRPFSHTTVSVISPFLIY
ncbi:hypothetical protein V6Z11_D11G072200 [Gossypium hirsutum]